MTTDAEAGVAGGNAMAADLRSPSMDIDALTYDQRLALAVASLHQWHVDLDRVQNEEHRLLTDGDKALDAYFEQLGLTEEDVVEQYERERCRASPGPN